MILHADTTTTDMLVLADLWLSFIESYKMNYDLLNSHLQQLVVSVHNQIQSPMPLIVNSMLTALSTAMQDFLVVEQPTGMKTPVSLYLLAIAESGERKTATDKIFSQPIRDFENSMITSDQEHFTKYETEHLVWKIKHDEKKKSFATAVRRNFANMKQIEAEYLDILTQEPQKPLTNRRMFLDSTIESLLFDLSQSRAGGLLISTEAGNFFSRVTTNYTSHLNCLWDGESIRIDRKSSNSFSLEQKPLTCAFMLQPNVLNHILKCKEDILRDSGLWARFLICKPDSTQGFRVFRPNTQNFHLSDFQERITELLEISSQFQAMGKIETLTFSEQATTVWIDFSNQVESLIGQMGILNDIKDYASKVLNNVSRIAALLHYYEFGYKHGQSGSTRQISVQSLKAAIQLTDYYILQFKLIFGEKTFRQEALELAKKVYDYLVKNYANNFIRFSKSWLLRNGPKQTRKKEKLDIALEQLIQDGYITLVNTAPITYRLTRKFIAANNLQYMGFEI